MLVVEQEKKKPRNRGFVVVSQGDLEQLNQFLTTDIIPRQLFYFRQNIQSAMAYLNEETLVFEQTELGDLELDAKHPSLHYLLEIPTRAFPEFVQEFMKCPFQDCVPNEFSTFRFLDKSAYNSILRASSELIAKITKNIKDHQGRNVKHNILNFVSDFYISDNPLLHHPSSCGFIQIDLSFDISYKED